MLTFLPDPMPNFYCQRDLGGSPYYNSWQDTAPLQEWNPHQPPPLQEYALPPANFAPLAQAPPAPEHHFAFAPLGTHLAF